MCVLNELKGFLGATWPRLAFSKWKMWKYALHNKLNNVFVLNANST